MEYIIISIIFLAGIIFYLNHRKKIRLKREEEERIRLETERRKREELDKLHNQQRKEIQPYLSQIIEFDNLFEEFKSQNKYLSNFELFNFKEVVNLFMVFFFVYINPVVRDFLLPHYITIRIYNP